MPSQTLVTFSEPLPEATPTAPETPAEGPDPSAAVEFATRVLTGWHFIAELSVLGQAMCACGQPWEYCEYRILARRCGL